MAGKRGNGDGSIYQRKSDGRWVAQLTGAGQKTAYIYGKSREQARTKLRSALRAQEDGLPVTVKHQTIEVFLAHWLEDAIKPTVRPRTYASYAQMVRLHIVPSLGRRQLNQLTAQDVQAFLRAKSVTKSRKGDSYLSARTVQYLRDLLRQALNQAVAWDLVPRNVATLTKPPRATRREVQTLDAEQAIALIKAARGDRLEALFLMTLATGARQGEVLGITWPELDLDAQFVHFRRQLQRIDGQYFLNTPKTTGSRRALPLLPLAVDALREHRDRQQFERIMAGDRWDNRFDLVFTTVEGAPLNARVVVSRFKAVLERANLPNVRFHDLRHSCASLLAHLGVHPSVAMAILGHSTSRLTLDLYTHVEPAQLRDAASRLQGLLSPTS